MKTIDMIIADRIRRRFQVICNECENITWQRLKNKRLPMFCNLNCYNLWKHKNPKTLGQNNYQWKGNDASYSAKHKWIVKHFGNSNKCENESCRGISTQFDWANISGKYKRERSDWKMMCRICHFKMDKSTLCRNGHVRTSLNTKIENGYNRCLDCRRFQW